MCDLTTTKNCENSEKKYDHEVCKQIYHPESWILGQVQSEAGFQPLKELWLERHPIQNLQGHVWGRG